jgi:hypothetical protein
MYYTSIYVQNFTKYFEIFHFDLKTRLLKLDFALVGIWLDSKLKSNAPC